MYCTLSSSSRVSSARVREAASTSIRSTLRPASISRQLAQAPQGLALTPHSQLRHLARMRATVVLPTPRVPAKRNAWCTRPLSSALASARSTCSCPVISAKLCGRHLRASAVYALIFLGGDPYQRELRHPTAPLPLLPSGPGGVHG